MKHLHEMTKAELNSLVEQEPQSKSNIKEIVLPEYNQGEGIFVYDFDHFQMLLSQLEDPEDRIRLKRSCIFFCFLVRNYEEGLYHKSLDLVYKKINPNSELIKKQKSLIFQ